MEDAPLIFLYRTLSKSECRRLHKWLDSPAHNQRDDVRCLHRYLVGGQDRLYKTIALTKSRLWKRVFPEEPFDDARLRQTMHWLLKALREFLAYENWRTRPVEQQLALVRELQQRKVGDLTDQHINRARKMQRARPFRNESFYRDQFLLEEQTDFHRSYHRLQAPPNFQEIADNLDLTYLIEKLRVSCNMIFHSRLHRTEFDLHLVEAAARRAEQLDLERYPALAIYYYGYRGLTEEDASGTFISKLRATINRHERVLTAFDLRHVILMAINLCVHNMNRGHEPYIREAFEWYRLGFGKDVVSENGLLTRATFMNVVAIALKLDETDWASDFIRDRAHQLEEEVRENTVLYTNASVAYARRDYDAAMPLLVTVDFRHPVYNLLSRTLLLKIYYELDEFDALDSLLDSMGAYIRRKSLSDAHRENFSNVLRYTRQLSRLPPGDKKKAARLRERMSGEMRLSEKKWLLERLADYE